MKTVRKITYCALLIAMGMVLPFLTGQIPEVGSALSPLHIPALLAGFLVGPLWGAVCAFVIPVFRSMIFGMPYMFPAAVTMAFEMAVYAGGTGVCQRLFPKGIGWVYLAQLAAMILGRMVYGIVFALLAGGYTFTAFITGCFVEALPGIVLHLVIIPPIVLALRRCKLTAV